MIKEDIPFQIDGLLRRMDENKDETVTVQEFIKGFPDVDSSNRWLLFLITNVCIHIL